MNRSNMIQYIPTHLPKASDLPEMCAVLTSLKQEGLWLPYYDWLWE